ncbi:hydrolase [Mycolicibacterium chitae]|uniref:Alpha/beta hydrolase n=1 Tax=Mycolicibacterium chitae TaxID=1792 RepID=A0A448IDF4_MYCCI|nr:alpha/beta fold hydrolase [Mycolicibacterium chitae]MCV7109127.1 alpha/beta fold hydrolase [Mycolicibacterium chitae]BBZ01491.1 hydrolase [Mycolicibacterium chitae]VEG50327.1 alpha/beta hydrolase [Mycolicibacterium chitae]
MDDLRYLDLNGDRISYWDSGDADRPETLLLIHGMSGSAAAWRHVAPLLAQRYRVIAPDLLGHGHSDKPRGDYSLGASAVWLRDFLDAVGVARVTVVGQSLGGGIAMQFAHQHRERCDRVVLIGSGGVGPELNWLLRVLSTPGAEYVLPAVTPKPVLDAGNVVRDWLTAAGVRSPRAAQLWNTYAKLSDAGTRHAFLGTLRSAADARTTGAVSALNRPQSSAQMPVLLVWGEQDRVMPVTQGHAAHEALTNSRLEVLAGVGHSPHAEAPDQVVDLIGDFLATTERRSVMLTRC